MNKPLQPFPHGIIDYATGILILASPWLLHFSDDSSIATNTMVIMGIVVLGLSLVTAYPLGAVKAVPFKTHGVIEAAGAVALLISPWLLGYSDVESARNFAVVVSIAWLAVVALTDYVQTTEHSTL